MAIHRFTSVALAVGLLVPAAAQREREASAEQALVALEQRWLTAEDDPAALESILADDFVHVLPAGFVSKREQLDFMRSHPVPAAQRPRSKRFDDLRVRVFGTAGVATGMVVATLPDGKVRKTVFTDVFAYRDGRWQAVNAQETPLGDSPGRAGGL
jgi:hypothetical protein